MSTSAHFENENLKERSTYFLWLLIVIAGVIGMQFLMPFIRPNRYSGSAGEWLFTIIIILALILYSLFAERFVSITFHSINKEITLRTMTLLNGEEIKEYADITFKCGRDAGSLRKQATDFIKIYSRGKRVITLEKTHIGDYTFEGILAALKQLTNSD
jgi:hypothetical protein